MFALPDRCLLVLTSYISLIFCNKHIVYKKNPKTNKKNYQHWQRGREWKQASLELAEIWKNQREILKTPDPNQSVDPVL